MIKVEQRDPKTFVFPQDLAGPDGMFIRYGGLSKLEWMTGVILQGFFSNPVALQQAAGSTSIIGGGNAASTLEIDKGMVAHAIAIASLTLDALEKAQAPEPADA